MKFKIKWPKFSKEITVSDDKEIMMEIYNNLEVPEEISILEAEPSKIRKIKDKIKYFFSNLKVKTPIIK